MDHLGADRGVPGSFSVAGDWLSGGEYVELNSGIGELALPFLDRGRSRIAALAAGLLALAGIATLGILGAAA